MELARIAAIRPRWPNSITSEIQQGSQPIPIQWQFHVKVFFLIMITFPANLGGKIYPKWIVYLVIYLTAFYVSTIRDS